VPDNLKSYFVIAAKRCPDVLTPWGLAAQAYVESGFDPDATSAAGAEGLMQIIPDVWSEYGTDATGNGTANPFSAADSIATSAKYSCELAKGVRNIPGNKTKLRLAAYNAGLGAVQRYNGIPPYRETRGYVSHITELTPQLKSQFSQN